MEVPADVNADKDHFKDVDRQNTLRQKLGNELRQAPWNENTSEQPLQELKRLMKTVKPVSPGILGQPGQGQGDLP